MNNILLVSSV